MINKLKTVRYKLEGMSLDFTKAYGFTVIEPFFIKEINMEWQFFRLDITNGDIQIFTEDTDGFFIQTEVTHYFDKDGILSICDSIEDVVDITESYNRWLHELTI